MSHSLANVEGRAALVADGHWYDLETVSGTEPGPDPMAALSMLERLSALTAELGQHEPSGAVEPERLGPPVLRLDNTEDLKRGKARTSVLRAISQSDPDWSRVHRPRNAGESVNSWIKERLRWTGARAMGIPKQRWTILCGSIFANFVAALMHSERVGEPWPDGLPGGKDRRSVPRRLPVRLTADGLKAFDVLVEQGIGTDELIERLVLEQASELG